MSGAISINKIDFEGIRQVEDLGVPIIMSSTEIVRPDGYAIAGMIHRKVTARLGNLRTEGWGSGDFAVAEAKATSEAYERLAFLHTEGGKLRSKSSNGWAAHFDERTAFENALAELIERDSALHAWFGSGRFLTVPECLWPRSLFLWLSKDSIGLEFGKPEVLLSIGPHGAAATVVLRSCDGGAVTGHASGIELELALDSAFREAVRAAHGALQFDSFSEVSSLHGSDASSQIFSPGANAYAYAYGVPLPELELRPGSEDEVQSEWSTHVQKFWKAAHLCQSASYKLSDRFVVQVKMQNFIEMFWGPTPERFRIKHSNPHFVG